MNDEVLVDNWSINFSSKEHSEVVSGTPSAVCTIPALLLEKHTGKSLTQNSYILGER